MSHRTIVDDLLDDFRPEFHWMTRCYNNILTNDSDDCSNESLKAKVLPWYQKSLSRLSFNEDRLVFESRKDLSLQVKTWAIERCLEEIEKFTKLHVTSTTRFWDIHEALRTVESPRGSVVTVVIDLDGYSKTYRSLSAMIGAGQDSNTIVIQTKDDVISYNVQTNTLDEMRNGFLLWFMFLTTFLDGDCIQYLERSRNQPDISLGYSWDNFTMLSDAAYYAIVLYDVLVDTLYMRFMESILRVPTMSNPRIMEMSGGEGRLAQKIMNRFSYAISMYILVEPQFELVKIAMDRLKTYGDKICVMSTDALAPSFSDMIKDNTVDIYIASGSILTYGIGQRSDVELKRSLFRTMARSIKEGGFMVLSGFEPNMVVDPNLWLSSGLRPRNFVAPNASAYCFVNDDARFNMQEFIVLQKTAPATERKILPRK